MWQHGSGSVYLQSLWELRHMSESAFPDQQETTALRGEDVLAGSPEDIYIYIYTYIYGHIQG